ncbi:MAG TPA: hypothetical protein VNH11_22230 [Pirellulales bacterium]|nr:hypothetical protein [Pirellulales bacterium]
MDDTSLPSDHRSAVAGGLTEAIAHGRRQARDYLVRQQRRLGEIEAVLAHEIGRISQQLALVREANLDAEAEIAAGRSELDDATHKLRHDERGLAQLRRECEADADELAWQRQRAQRKLTDLEAQRDQLDRMEIDLKRRRRQLAYELRARREDPLREPERRKHEIPQPCQSTGENEAAAQQLALADQHVAELERSLAAANRRQSEADAQVALANQRVAELERSLTAANPCPSETAAQDDLREALADMQRRYDLAMDDLRERKRRVTELEQQPVRPAAAATAEPDGKLDWEAQKQRMLAALEADTGDDDAERQEERLRIRDVVARTDEALAAKDRQIEELEGLLAAQSANIGEVAVGAAAFAELLSGDEVVRNERERLQQLQHEWEEKLRQAEIDLSVQRAKLARERAEIEERQRSLHDNQAGPPSSTAGAPAVVRPDRGRWLARLGLKEEGP